MTFSRITVQVFSSGCPLRVAGKKSIRKTDLISEQDPEGQTHQAGSEAQPVRKLLVPSSKESEGGGDAHRNQHHASDRAGSKDKQVSNRPVRIPDGCEDEQSHCSGTGEPMNHTHYQGAKLLIETDPAK